MNTLQPSHKQSRSGAAAGGVNFISSVVLIKDPVKDIVWRAGLNYMINAPVCTFLHETTFMSQTAPWPTQEGHKDLKIVSFIM